GPAPRADFGPPFDEMRRRAALPADQTLAWTQAVGTSTDYPNPFTAYTVSGGYRLPGQTDFAALAPIVGRLYAEQVLRVVDAEPERLKMHLFRPNHSQRHERQIASPVEAFVRGASWIPTVRGLMPLHHAWIGSESRTPPPGLPTVDYEFRTLMLRHETADTELRGLGMPSYGAVGSAARFLVVAGAAISEGLDGATAERWLSAAQEAWSRVDLIAAPSTELRVLCRADGAIVAVDPREATGPLIIIADGDDRQLLAAKMRTQQAFAIFEPPPTRLADVAGHLHQHFPFRMLRASSLRATYVAGDLPVTFDPSDPLIEVELGDRLREIVALTVRYNNAFFRTDVEEVLQ
ncbi:MAG: hypothetical protein GY736_17170, partial [Sphingomonas sp.]|uniref:hypothetical protein n=1 Tax=Sphingomonas sp. TaxID=28214 RepID=UPI002586A8BA